MAKIKKNCLVCNKEISAFPSRVKEGKGKFCSKKCYAEWQSKNRIGKRAYNWKGGEIKKECAICGKIFNTIKSRKDIRMTCSRKCQHKYHSLYLRKEKNPNWKGGINPLMAQIRGSFKYRQWRSDVYTKDNFTCQECGVRGIRINAHHIKSFLSIIEEYKIKTLKEAENCEELWNINNGITFCERCHYENYK